MDKFKHLGRIDNNIIDSWGEEFEKRDGYFYCRKCGSQIMQTTCYMSIHDKLFEPKCVGGGEVRKVNCPYCLKCDGDIDYVTACCHI